MSKKIQQDNWNLTPPQVTSYFTIPLPLVKEKDYSETCDFRWRFQFLRRPRTGSTSLAVSFDPYLCLSMPRRIRSIKVIATQIATGFEDSSGLTTEMTSSASFREISTIGTCDVNELYSTIKLQVTVVFNEDEGIPLHTTTTSSMPMTTKKALHTSLNGPSFVDTKFYLYSSRTHGQPAVPRAVYGNSIFLKDASTYFRDLLSDTTFNSGTQCNLHQDVPEELDKLQVKSYDYELDGDLEDIDGDEDDHSGCATSDHEQPTVNELQVGRSAIDSTFQGDTLGLVSRGKAYAINGTAYRTWKAFIFYTYTNGIHFCPLKSQKEIIPESHTNNGHNFVTCSAKSMYRFADYADIAPLKQLACRGIRERLCKQNIVTELFSNFTSRYQEIIEMEVDFLAQNLTTSVARDLDFMLQAVVLGNKSVCYRTLAFTMRRLRGEKASIAWKALDEPKKTT